MSRAARLAAYSFILIGNLKQGRAGVNRGAACRYKSLLILVSPYSFSNARKSLILLGFRGICVDKMSLRGGQNVAAGWTKNRCEQDKKSLRISVRQRSIVMLSAVIV